MKVALASYQSLMLIHGGPHVVITELKHNLNALGVEADYFDMWQSENELRRYDLIHLFGCNMEIYSLARNLKQRGFRFIVNPIFFTRHSPTYIRWACMIQRQINRFYAGIYTDYGLVQSLCRMADLVQPNTSEEAHLVTKGLRIPEHKIRILHNGVSEEFIHGDPDLFYRRYGIKNFILNVGHIGPVRKNTLALVRALKNIDHPAVIIGRITPDEETDRILEESKSNPRLLIIHGLDHHSPMLASAYAACDVFVLPSRYETPGLAALEAALAGAKIVITPYGGTRDYFGHYADYINPYSVDDIRRGILESLAKPKNRQLREHIRSRFIWPVIAQNMKRLYEELLIQSSPSASPSEP